MKVRFMKALLKTAGQIGALFGEHKKLWLPFLFIAFVELLMVGVLWLAPQAPFSKLLAPPIQFFFGNRAVHYPWHLWFLYHAMKHTHLFTSLLVGAFLSGVACLMVRQIHEGKSLSLRNTLHNGEIRYFRVVILWAIAWAVARAEMQVLSIFFADSVWVLWLSVALAVILQTLFIYAIPAAVYNRVSWPKALFQGIKEAVRYPISTLLIVAIPSAAIFLYSAFFSPVRVAQLMMRMGLPEVSILFIFIRLAVWTLADICMTVGVAHLWWFHREEQAATEKRLIENVVAQTEGQAAFEEGPVHA